MAKFKLKFKFKLEKNPILALKAFASRKTGGLKKNQSSTTIAIDADNMAFHFYTMTGGNRHTAEHQIKNFAGTLFDANFFKRFKQALKSFVAENPIEGIRRVTLVLPDSAVLTDVIKIPTMRGVGKTQKSFELTLRGLYRNLDELQVKSYPAIQNRHHTTYALTALQKRIITQLYSACSENGMLVETLTFASASTAAAVSVFHPKQKNATYLFLDIKDTASHFTFVSSGKVTGFYALPFGLDFLRKPKVVGEDMLFDHSYAELAVLNAKEKAKSKKLTVMSIDGVTGISDEEEEAADREALTADAIEEAPAETATEVAPPAEAENDEEMEEEEEDTAEVMEIPMPQASVSRMSTPKLFVRKTARRLPKFMQRPAPETEEDTLYENFRIFVKWTLTLIASNEKLTELGTLSSVYVNLPRDLASVLDRVNLEIEENGIRFLPFVYGEEDADVASKLSLFGGFYPKQITAGKF